MSEIPQQASYEQRASLGTLFRNRQFLLRAVEKGAALPVGFIGLELTLNGSPEVGVPAMLGAVAMIYDGLRGMHQAEQAVNERLIHPDAD